MIQVATEITLSVAERVRQWTRQERDLAIALRALHTTVSPPPAPDSVMPEVGAPSVLPSPLSVAMEPDLRLEQLLEEPADGTGLPIGGPSLHDGSASEMTPPTPLPAAPTGASMGTFEQRDLHVDAYPSASTVPGASDVPVAPSGPFDDFITAIADAPAAPPVPMPPLPPPARFMVRVAPVGQPHRATKRNYDYFEELNARLAAQSAPDRQSGRP